MRVLAALALLVALAAAQPLTDGLLKDREALLALRDAVTDFGQSKMASWRPTGNPCFPKPWKHLTCAASRVVEINLANRAVAGVLPAKLRLAQMLQTINFDGNKFTGGIPDIWADKNSFSNLRTLNLANNDLSGALPNWNRLGAWRSLKTVDLSGNRFYNGLPANWLGKQTPLRSVQYLDLSNNFLGRANGSVTGDLLTKANWCKTEAAAGLSTGSGWCPTGTPVTGTTASMISLDLSNNALDGEVPLQWPKMFPRLQYLQLEFNTLRRLSGSTAIPSVLPREWTDARLKGFPVLSMLSLYPGNDNLCSMPSVDGGFIDVNVDASYQITDKNGDVYNNDNPRLCPTEFTADNPPTATDPTGTSSLSWTLSVGANKYIWGYKLTIWGQDREGDTWSPIEGWNAVLLRVYTDSSDGFDAADVTAQGLDGTCTATGTSTCTLTFGNTITDSRMVAYKNPDFNYQIKAIKFDISTINLDAVESSVDTTASYAIN